MVPIAKNKNQSTLLNHFVLRTIKSKQDDRLPKRTCTDTGDGEVALRPEPTDAVDANADDHAAHSLQRATHCSDESSTTAVIDVDATAIIGEERPLPDGSLATVRLPPPSSMPAVSSRSSGSSKSKDKDKKRRSRMLLPSHYQDGIDRRSQKQKRADDALKSRAQPVSNKKRRTLPPPPPPNRNKKSSHTTTTTTTSTTTPTPATPHHSTRCSFCSTTAAAISIRRKQTIGDINANETPGQRRRAHRPERPLCLVHYYTTRASRADTALVRSFGDGKEMERQLPAVRRLFAEVFLEVRGEIAEESARSFRRTCRDPLSVLTGVGGGGKRRKVVGGRRRGVGGLKQDRTTGGVVEGIGGSGGVEKGGGFLDAVQPRERVLMGEQQRRIERATDRVEQPATGVKRVGKRRQAPAGKVVPNLYRRRKATGNIWNDVLSSKRKGGGGEDGSGTGPSGTGIDWNNGVTCGGCGEKDVEVLGNIVGRNNDVNKADVWGMARDSDVSTRYQCQKCGLKWNEED